MVLKRCIYGVDKNPLAVELAKVSLWLHSFTVGAPLSFLDHHLRCGDSLLGLRVTEGIEDLRRLGGLFTFNVMQGAENATNAMQDIERLSDADITEVEKSSMLFRSVEQTTAGLRSVLDILCGLRWLTAGLKKNDIKALEIPLVEALDANRESAFSLIAQGSNGSGFLVEEFKDLWRKARAIADRENFLHWEAAFPGVWEKWQDAHPRGGFDAVIGNPPWDRIEQLEKEWFDIRDKEVAQATTGARRKALIEKKKKAGDRYAIEYETVQARAATMREFVRTSEIYPLLSGGRINFYSLFVERALALVKDDGLVGLLTPSGIYADKTARQILQERFHRRACRRAIRFRESTPRYRPLAVLPGPGLALQVLRPHYWRHGTAVRRDCLRLLPPRHQGPSTTLTAASPWRHTTLPWSIPTPAPLPSSAPVATPASPASSTPTTRFW